MLTETAAQCLWQLAHPHQLLEGLRERCKLPRWSVVWSPGKFEFWSILGPHKSHQNAHCPRSNSAGHFTTAAVKELTAVITVPVHSSDKSAGNESGKVFISHKYRQRKAKIGNVFLLLLCS